MFTNKWTLDNIKNEIIFIAILNGIRCLGDMWIESKTRGLRSWPQEKKEVGPNISEKCIKSWNFRKSSNLQKILMCHKCIIILARCQCKTHQFACGYKCQNIVVFKVSYVWMNKIEDPWKIYFIWFWKIYFIWFS